MHISTCFMGYNILWFKCMFTYGNRHVHLSLIKLIASV